MTKKWTKPVVAVAAIGLAGALTLSLDGVAQALDPLHPHEEHDTFQLVRVSTASDTVIVRQDTITGDLVEIAWPGLVTHRKAKGPGA